MRVKPYIVFYISTEWFDDVTLNFIQINIFLALVYAAHVIDDIGNVFDIQVGCAIVSNVNIDQVLVKI